MSHIAAFRAGKTQLHYNYECASCKATAEVRSVHGNELIGEIQISFMDHCGDHLSSTGYFLSVNVALNLEETPAALMVNGKVMEDLLGSAWFYRTQAEVLAAIASYWTSTTNSQVA